MTMSLSIASTTTITFPTEPFSKIPKSTFNGIQIRQSWPIRTPLRFATSSSGSRGSSTVVMMAKREEEIKEIRAKTTEEINEEVVDLKGELFMLRLQKSVRNEFKSSEFRRMRRRVLPLFFFLFSVVLFEC